MTKGFLHCVPVEKIRYEKKRIGQSSFSTSHLGSMMCGINSYSFGNPFLGFRTPQEYQNFNAQQTAQANQESLIRQYQEAQQRSNFGYPSSGINGIGFWGSVGNSKVKNNG
jgi:hypothetical protein